jgi:hypothetical protein
MVMSIQSVLRRLNIGPNRTRLHVLSNSSRSASWLGDLHKGSSVVGELELGASAAMSFA